MSFGRSLLINIYIFAFSLVSLSWYLQSELHVKVSGPQKLQQEAVREGPNAGQAAGQHRPAPQAAQIGSQVLRVVGKFIELRPVHVALRPGYILPPSRGSEEGEEEEEG